MVETEHIRYSLNDVILDLECQLTKKVNNPNILNYLYIIASLMINYYGIQYKNDIYKVILSTMYIIDDNYSFKLTHTIRDVLSKDINGSSNYVMSICNINTSSSNEYSSSYSLCITNKRLSNIDYLESMLKEINKIFMSVYRPFKFGDKDVLLRCGLSYTNITKKVDIEYNKTINDVILTLQIENMMKLVKYIKYCGSDKVLNKLLNKLKEYDMDKILLDCCLPLVNLFRPLYDIDGFSNLINEAMINGDIESIKNEFDSVLGFNSFYNMSIKLDKLYKDFYYGNLGIKVSEYSISKDYVLIRDNFIYRYLKKKHA